MQVNYKIILFLILICSFGCSVDEEAKPNIRAMLSIEVRKLSENNDSIKFELVIKNISKQKIEISSDGEKFEKSLVSEIELNAQRIVVQNFPTNFSIDANKSEKHQFDLNIALLDDMKSINKTKFHLGIMKWRIGASSIWEEFSEGIYLESK